MRLPASTLIPLLPLLGGVAANVCHRITFATTGAEAATAATDTGATGTAATDTGATGTAATDTGATGTAATDTGAIATGATGGTGATGTASAAGAGSTATDTAASDTSGTGDTLTLSAPAGDCKCGYSISSLNDVFFPYSFTFAFSSEKDRTFASADELSDKGWVVNDGLHAGGEGESGNQCWGRYENLAIESGDLVLTVPGGQTLSSNMDCAEISFGTAVTGGVFQTEAMISDVAGTCEAFWLNHSIATMYADEVDIEILTSKIQSDGIWYTNWPPFGDPNNPSTLQSVFTKANFPTSNDPTKTYNNYTIVWLNGDDGKNLTTRYYNGVANESPTSNLPVHPMIFTINNWMNGGSGWSGGPPTEDAQLRVKNVALYYKTEKVTTMTDLDKDCTAEKLCKV